MSVIAAIATGVTGIAKGVTDLFHKDKEIKAAEVAGRISVITAEAEAKVIRSKADAERALRQVDNESSWDMEALRQMAHSWKDEFLMLVLLAPIIMTFGAGVLDGINDKASFSETMMLAWENMGLIPAWYQITLLGIVAASFGLRWLIQLIIPVIMRFTGKGSPAAPGGN